MMNDSSKCNLKWLVISNLDCLGSSKIAILYLWLRKAQNILFIRIAVLPSFLAIPFTGATDGVKELGPSGAWAWHIWECTTWRI